MRNDATPLAGLGVEDRHRFAAERDQCAPIGAEGRFDEAVGGCLLLFPPRPLDVDFLFQDSSLRIKARQLAAREQQLDHPRVRQELNMLSAGKGELWVSIGYNPERPAALCIDPC